MSQVEDGVEKTDVEELAERISVQCMLKMKNERQPIMALPRFAGIHLPGARPLISTSTRASCMEICKIPT
jgi:hypothetical protein